MLIDLVIDILLRLVGDMYLGCGNDSGIWRLYILDIWEYVLLLWVFDRYDCLVG